MLTPTEELNVVNACLDIAADNFTRAKNRLEPIQGHPLARNLLCQFQLRITQLQKHLAELEQGFQNLTTSSCDEQRDS